MDDLILVNVVCTCPFCKKENVVTVGYDDYEKYENGAKAQDCFPYLSADDRELLISGICPECWSDI